MIECYCGKCERLDEKLDKLLSELRERLEDLCPPCKDGKKHILNEEQGIFFYEITQKDGSIRYGECGSSWIRDLLDRFKK